MQTKELFMNGTDGKNVLKLQWVEYFSHKHPADYKLKGDLW